MYFCDLFLEEFDVVLDSSSRSVNIFSTCVPKGVYFYTLLLKECQCILTGCSLRSVNVFSQVVPEGTREVRDAAGGRGSLLRDVGGEVLDLRHVL